VKWNKHEFLPGLVFLFLYSLLEVIDLFFITIIHDMYFDVAQFGFYTRCDYFLYHRDAPVMVSENEIHLEIKGY